MHRQNHIPYFILTTCNVSFEGDAETDVRREDTELAAVALALSFVAVTAAASAHEEEDMVASPISKDHLSLVGKPLLALRSLSLFLADPAPVL